MRILLKEKTQWLKAQQSIPTSPPITAQQTHLPELGTDLVTALTSLNVYDFSHFIF